MVDYTIPADGVSWTIIAEQASKDEVYHNYYVRGKLRLGRSDLNLSPEEVFVEIPISKSTYDGLKKKLRECEDAGIFALGKLELTVKVPCIN